MPPKKSKPKSKLLNTPFGEYLAVLAKVRKDPKYKNKPYSEQQQIAKRIFHKI